jgi:hypothetical protein
MDSSGSGYRPLAGSCEHGFRIRWETSLPPELVLAYQDLYLKTKLIPLLQSRPDKMTKIQMLES